MAWTWSAPQRGTVAVAILVSAGQQSMFNHLSYLGKGDAARGVCIACAAILTAAGALAPHLPHLVLTACLFLAGASLALAAATGVFDTHSRSFSDVKRRDRSVSDEARPSVFAELMTREDSRSMLDSAAWARLTAHMSHELRTPLNAVLGFSELMSNEVFGPMGASCYTDYARDIHASGRMLLKSAEDALAITALLTAPERKGPAPALRLSAALDDALAFHAHDPALRNIALSAAIDLDCEILGDAQTVRQILINLFADTVSRAAVGARIEISSRISAGHIDLVFMLSGPCSAKAPDTGGFALLLAQTLSELSGARLSHTLLANGDWQTAASFTPATQRDFFALRGGTYA